jgi:hypothetical protein
VWLFVRVGLHARGQGVPGSTLLLRITLGDCLAPAFLRLYHAADILCNVTVYDTRSLLRINQRHWAFQI